MRAKLASALLVFNVWDYTVFSAYSMILSLDVAAELPALADF